MFSLNPKKNNRLSNNNYLRQEYLILTFQNTGQIINGKFNFIHEISDLWKNNNYFQHISMFH